MSAQPFFLDIPKHVSTARDAARAAFADSAPEHRGAAELSEPGRFERLVSDRLAQPRREPRDSGASDDTKDAQKSTDDAPRDDERTGATDNRAENEPRVSEAAGVQKELPEPPEPPESPKHPERAETDPPAADDHQKQAPDNQVTDEVRDRDAEQHALPPEPQRAESPQRTDANDSRTEQQGRAVQRPAAESRPESGADKVEVYAGELATTGVRDTSTRPDAEARPSDRPAPVRAGEEQSERPQRPGGADRAADRAHSAERTSRQDGEPRPPNTSQTTGGAQSQSGGATVQADAGQPQQRQQPVGPAPDRTAETSAGREANRAEPSEYRVAESMRESGGERRSDGDSSPDRDDRSRPDARAAAAANAADRAAGARSSAFVELMDPSRAQVRSATAPTLSANGAGAPSTTAAPTLGAAASPGGAELSEADQRAFQASVSRGLGAAVRQRGGVMTLRLNPASLGTMRIEMSIRQGAVSARIEASTQQAQQLLMRNMTQLRSALEGRGLSVERLQVTFTPAPSGGPASESGQQDAQPGSQDRSSRQDAGDGQSRGAFDRRGEHGAEGSEEHDDGGSGPEGLSDQQREPGFHGRLRLRLNAVA